MLRLAVIATPFLLLGLGCATPNPSHVLDGETLSVTSSERPPVDNLTDSDLTIGVLTESAPDSEMVQGASPPRQRFTLKGGYYGSSEDGIDDGYIINASWLRPTSGNLCSEVEIGYLDASGTDKGVDRDVWAIPLIANGRINVPVGQKIELYGGIGLGTIYYNVDAKAAGVHVSADGFLFAGDAYFGGDIHLGQDVSVGLEGKYYVTDNTSDLGGGLDAYVVLLTLGFDR